MSPSPGHNPGHAVGEQISAPPGYSWADYVAHLVAQEGTLTAVAEKVAHAGKRAFDINSVERALRRLRERGQRDGGVWGQRLLRSFGLPQSVEARVRWMGLYHSPFSDLPVEQCLDLLRVWDRPPIRESRARAYLELGFATCALLQRAFDGAATHLRQALAALGAPHPGDVAARIEHALSSAYLESHVKPENVPALLEQADLLMASGTLEATDRACFAARLADQRAFRDNHEGTAAGTRRALERYQALTAEPVHPFASYRREAGLAFGHFMLKDHEQALSHARLAVRHAGDGGFVRLRAMGLLLEARIVGAADPEPLERASAIATRLSEQELLARVERARQRSR